MTGNDHTYRSELSWAGSTGAGYQNYDRAHHLAGPPSVTGLTLSADPAFGGDPSLLNPEQLLLAAASSCQLLSFLAVAAAARLNVVAYTDESTAVMPGDDLPMRITRIELHPHVTLTDTPNTRPTDARLIHLTEVAHRQCFIANSLRSDIVVTPSFHWVD